MFIDITGLNCGRIILIQLNSVHSVHSEQKLGTTKNKIKILPLLLSLHRVICIFMWGLYFLRFCGFCHLNFKTGAQSPAGCRQARSLGFLKAPGAQVPGWVSPMVYGAVGSVWGQLWVSCGKEGSGHWLPADPGTGENRAGEGGKRRLLSDSTTRCSAGVCRLQPGIVLL